MGQSCSGAGFEEGGEAQGGSIPSCTLPPTSHWSPAPHRADSVSARGPHAGWTAVAAPHRSAVELRWQTSPANTSPALGGRLRPHQVLSRPALGTAHGGVLPTDLAAESPPPRSPTLVVDGSVSQPRPRRPESLALSRGGVKRRGCCWCGLGRVAGSLGGADRQCGRTAHSSRRHQGPLVGALRWAAGHGDGGQGVPFLLPEAGVWSSGHLSCGPSLGGTPQAHSEGESSVLRHRAGDQIGIILSIFFRIPKIPKLCT